MVCTDDAVRSGLAGGMRYQLAGRRGREGRAYSAGIAPGGRINPFAVEGLTAAGIDCSGFRSKSWDEFTHEQSPPLGAVITVCDSAAAETCPIFHGGHGQPVKAHWGYPYPSNAEGGHEFAG